MLGSKAVCLGLRRRPWTVSDEMPEPSLNPVSRGKAPFLFAHRTLWLGVLCAAVALWGAFQLDPVVLGAVRKHSTYWSRWVAHQVSVWGDSYGVAALGLLGWWWAQRRDARQWRQLFLIMGICGALGGLGANVIRALSGRTRPNYEAAAGWYGPSKALSFTKSAHAFQSFPSAHTGVVAGFCAPLGWVALRSHRRRRRLLGLSVALSGTALMAWARVWIGAHHLSDVLAAALLGWGIALTWVHYRAPELSLDT